MSIYNYYFTIYKLYIKYRVWKSHPQICIIKYVDDKDRP